MTTTINHSCRCIGKFEVIDASGYSKTVRCRTCDRCYLIIEHPAISTVIRLADFHLKRGDGPNQRPLDDLGMATKLVDCLCLDLWPSMAAVVDFGIESRQHVGALQYAVQYCMTAYDLDRVMGDGPAITRLVRCIPYQPYPHIEFRTPYDDRSWHDEKA